MTVERFPIEEGHVLLFARAIGDPNPAYRRAEPGAGDENEILAPPTFVQASAQFDPDYPLRPHEGRPWFGSGATPTGLAPATAGGGSRDTGSSRDSGSGGDEPKGSQGSGGASASGSSGGSRGSGGAGAASGTGLHAEQRYEYHRPLRVGDVLSSQTRLGKTWQKEGRRGGTLSFAEMVTEYRDEAGELVVTATSVGVRTEKVPDQTGAS